MCRGRGVRKSLFLGFVGQENVSREGAIGAQGDDEAILEMGTGKKSRLVMMAVWAEMNKGSYELDKGNGHSRQWVWIFRESSGLWLPPHHRT